MFSKIKIDLISTVDDKERHRISTILSNDSRALERREIIFRELGLPEAELLELNRKMNLEDFGAYGFFMRLLSNYESRNGSRATVSSVANLFVKLNLNSVVGE